MPQTMKQTLVNLISMLYNAAMETHSPIRRAEYFRHMTKCVEMMRGITSKEDN